MINTYASTTKWNEDVANASNWFSVDFSEPGQFTKYGLAQEYYEGGLEYLTTTFPYDKSWLEKRDWYAGLCLCDKYLYHNVLESSNGYAVFSPGGWGAQTALHDGRFGEPATKEYIRFFGGPHNPEDEFDTSNIVNSSKNLTSNLSFGVSNTIEFFMKRLSNPDVANTTQYECVCDIRNNKVYGAGDFSAIEIFIRQKNDGDLGRITFILTINGTAYQTETSLINEVGDDQWHHYALNIEASSVSTDLVIFVDGAETIRDSFAALSTVVDRDIVGTIGASQAMDGTYPLGSNKLRGSLDEFRFWKSARTTKEIALYSHTCVYGGTNTSEENSELGVYYKFNEGITAMPTIDAHVLDFSGRGSNGTWVGYTSGSRALGSAIEDGNFGKLEEKDISIYTALPSYAATFASYSRTGEVYDLQNTHSVFKQLPRWVVAQDRTAGGKDLKRLAHIIGSFFDTLFILGFNGLFAQGQDYSFVGNVKPEYNFSFLSSLGIKMTDLLDGIEWSEFALGANSTTSFEQSVEKIKRIVLGNLANELDILMKQKGTKKAIASILKNFGPAEEAVQPLVFVQNKPLEYEDKYAVVSSRKRVANFSGEAGTGAVITHAFATSESPFISGIPAEQEQYNMTFQCRFAVPQEPYTDNLKFAVFGAHGVALVGLDYVWADPDTDAFVVYVERPSVESKSGRFILELRHTLGGVVEETTDWFNDVFDGSVWTLNVAFLNRNAEEAGFLSDGAPVAIPTDYAVVFSGKENQDSTVRWEFSEDVTVHANLVPEFLLSDKCVYVGSHREDFVGDIEDSAEDYACCLVDSLVVWSRAISDEEHEYHAVNFKNRGAGFVEDVDRYADQDLAHASRVIDWQFEQDITLSTHATLGYVTNELNESRVVCSTHSTNAVMLGELHPFMGYLFDDDELGSCFDVFYFPSRVCVAPERFADNELVSLGDNYEREIFKKSNIYPKKMFSVEKNVNFMLDDMIFDIFGGLKYIYNLFSDGYQKYEVEYYRLKPAAEHFLAMMNNTYIDFDTFFEYLRWIDASVGNILEFFVTTQFSKTKTGKILRNTVASHALEREKYWWKRIETEVPENNFEGIALGAEFNDYNWAIGHYKTPDVNFEQTLFWKERAPRDLAEITSGDSAVDANREAIRVVAIGGETPNYVLGARNKPYIFRADGEGTMGGVSCEIEPCILQNGLNSANSNYSEVPPAGLDPAAEALRASVSRPKARVGNYSKNYQVVHSGGRLNNNLGFRRDQWAFTSLLPDDTKPRVFLETDYGFLTTVSSWTTSESYGFPRENNRQKTDSIFVTKFAAPGDRTTSDGFRDGESLELCSYCSVNYRNLSVRHDLDAEWSL